MSVVKSIPKELLVTAAFAAPALLFASRRKKGAKKRSSSGPQVRNVLPKTVLPTNYNLELTPDLENHTFAGTVTVQVKVSQPTRSVVLHAKHLDITKAEVQSERVTWTNASKIAYDAPNETATLSFPVDLPVGSATLRLAFTGTLSDRLSGFYRSAYEKDGQKRWMGVTQFEATHAREAFPCWDEPEHKAIFTITLRVPEDRTALSNMPVAREVRSGGYKTVEFQPTPLVSTYLLAWVVGEFDFVEGTTDDGVLFRVYTQCGKSQQGLFALDVGIKALTFFSQYFAIGFPLPKMDMIAVPDFAAGAMENWGLVTYRETALLFDPDLSSSASKEKVANTVAHELAHQWFGNLVSPAWWSYLWLNEGFATWAATLATNEIFPEWDLWTKFVCNYVASAFRQDGLRSSHPIEVEVLNSGAISEIFDAISYFKGSTVIRMLADYLGATTFRDGLRTYLKTFQYRCATTEDLWTHLANASGKPVHDVMDNWIKKTGYPFVQISEVGSAANGDKLVVKLRQKLFLSTGIEAEREDDVLWYCPVRISVKAGEQEVSQLLEFKSREATFEVSLPEGTKHWEDSWHLKANVGMCGFFRIEYDQSLLKRVVPALSSLQLATDRMSLQSDLFALAQAGACSTARALELASGYREETEYSIWLDLSTSLAGLYNLYSLRNETYAPHMQLFLRWLYYPIARSVGWEAKDNKAEDHSRVLLRSLVLSMAIKGGDREVIDEALLRFARHVSGEATLPNDLRALVYSAAAQYGGRDAYNKLLALYYKAEMNEERVRILSVLGSSTDPELLLQTLDFAISDKVRSQDAVYCVGSVSRTSVGKPLAWQWFKSNWSTLFAKFGGGVFMMANFVEVVCSGFASTAMADEISQFFKGKDISGVERSIEQAKERILMNARAIDRNQSETRAFLAKGAWHGPPGGKTTKVVGKRILLPKNARPQHYDLWLSPDLNTFEVKGRVTITLDLLYHSRWLKLHSHGLTITESYLELSSGGRVAGRAEDLKNGQDWLCIHLEREVQPQKGARLVLVFDGKLNEQLSGFYRSAYDKNGEKRYMGTTQFEPTDARKAFPCWDEPEIKAVFEISLEVPVDRVALSNMPVKDTQDLGNGKKLVQFEKTPVVSTYLLAWVVGEFDFVQDTTPEGIEFRVYTLEGKSEQGLFALDVGVWLLRYFSEYFGIGYPLPKMDMIAIPDFAAGAMENWGLVTYRETALLYDPATSSASSKERVAYVVAHELAHQWFGNLVSPEWWSYLWLNEGFATWVGTVGVHARFPEWDSWTKFVGSYVASALKVDALASSHPIEVEVENAGQVMELFDAISYYKGSSAIRMLAEYLGPIAFRDGLRAYLKAKQYGNATTEDLWHFLGQASKQPVAHIMDNWVKTTGYPFVNVERVRNSNSGNEITLKLTQNLFLSTGIAPSDATWFCPVSLLITAENGESVKQQLLLEKKTQEFRITLPSGASSQSKWWIKANLDMSGFFRVMYDEELLERLGPHITSLKSSVDRLSVTNDLFNLGQAGAVPISRALKAATSYRDETDLSIWQDLIQSLSTLADIYAVEKEPYAEQMKAFIRWLLKPIVNKVGWVADPKEPQPTTLLRPLVILAIGRAGDKEVTWEASQQLTRQLQGSAPVASDLQQAVYSLALESSSASHTFDDLIQLFEKASMNEEKVRILGSLGASHSPELLQKALDFAFSDRVRSQDSISVVASVARNPIGRPLAWAWLQNNWETVMTRYGNSLALANYIAACCGAFASKARLAEVEAFFAGKSVPGGERAIQQAKEKIGMLATALERDRASVAEFLSAPKW